MVLETIAIAGLTIAGKSLFGRVIYDTYDLVKDTAYHPEVNGVLTEIDLEADLKVIEALVNQLAICCIEDNGPLAICLHQVDEMVHLIRNELKSVKQVLEDHQNKYFARLRTPSYHSHLGQIVKHKKILDKRVQMLIELVKLRK